MNRHVKDIDLKYKSDPLGKGIGHHYNFQSFAIFIKRISHGADNFA